MAEVVIRELRKARTLKSASWAAYGDALGFITELASPSIIRRRIGSTTAQVTVPWTRLIGGRMGAEVPLPAGSYSDDTQLRLATSRAIRGDGAFDVESFAKVELPIWLTYALGAGRGTKAAAENLAGKKATWFSNFFSSAGSEYVNGGGNGAAMRVQPHVWASPRLSEPEFLPDVIRNAICTHGHVRGIAGAMIHAASLASVLMDGVVEEPRSWLRYSGVIRRLPEIISRDSDLSTFWLPTWESVSGRSLEEEVIEVSEEWNAAVHQVIELNRYSSKKNYESVVKSLGGLSPAERGSGIKCALFALVAAFEFGNDVERAMEVIANNLDSDTDTIATMCGALMGAVDGTDSPTLDIQDRDYIEREAERMFAISQGLKVESTGYPDLLYWHPPKPLDAIASYRGSTFLSGFGPIEPVSEEYSGPQKDTLFQWFRLEFGQTVLCKRRVNLRPLHESSLQGVRVVQSRQPLKGRQMNEGLRSEGDLFGLHATSTLDDLTDAAIRSGFNEELIGSQLLRFAESENGIEMAIAYAAVVVKAKRARSRRR